MKKQGFKSLAFIAAAGVLTTSCDLLKDLDYAVAPNPLEMHGDSVKVKVDITFPEKGIKKKAYAEIYPAIGNTPLKPITVVGEKATANGKVIPYKPGGKVVYQDMVAYTPDMEVSELKITGKVFKGDKEKDNIEETKIADATIITPLLVNKDFKAMIAKDEFKRITQEVLNAEIHYLKGRHEVRATELRHDDIKALEDFLKEAETNEKLEIKNIKITGYASIEGEEDKNNTLSQNRSTSAKDASKKIAAKKAVSNNMAKEDESYITTGKGEDYEGFKKALIASDMDKGEKDLIIRILEMYSNSAQREKEIRNLGKTFTYLDKNVFPEQRRSEIAVNYDKIGYSDEELISISKTNVDALKVEEILFTATLTDDLNEKLRLYKAAERLFPQDYRGVNNVGTVLFMQNDLSGAKIQFEKANNIKENEVSKNNLAALAGIDGDRENAKSLLAEAGSADEVKYNKGILAIQDGRYSDALSNFGDDSFNKALAALLNNDISKAKSAIEASADAETAQGYYLQALIGARQDNIGDIVKNLKSAIAKDASWKDKAAKDREFIKYHASPLFTDVVNN